MAGLRIEGNTSGNVAEVDGYHNLQVNMPITEAQAGFVTLSCETDAGTVTGTRSVKALEATEDFRLRVGMDTLIFNEAFAATTINTNIWTYPTSTMTVVVSSGWCVLNNGNSTTSTQAAQLNSWRYFPVLGTFTTYLDMTCSLAMAAQTNNVTEWGFGIASGTSAPTDGAFFRLAADQTFKCVLSYGGSETLGGTLSLSSLVPANTSTHFLVTLSEDAAEYWINDIKVTRIARPAANPYIVQSGSLPVFYRTYNSGSAGGAQQLKVGQTTVYLGEGATGKPWSHIMAGSGQMLYQYCSGAGTTGQTAQFAISANPTNFTPSASTSPSGCSGLGGIFNPTINGLAATTDYIIQSFLNPAGTAAIPGKTLYITGYKFDAANFGATMGANLLPWVVGLHCGSTNVNPATGESATAKASRRIVIGCQSLAASAAIGTLASPNLVADFSRSPIVIQPGEYIQTFMRFIVYNSTASQTLLTFPTFIGYWE